LHPTRQDLTRYSCSLQLGLLKVFVDHRSRKKSFFVEAGQRIFFNFFISGFLLDYLPFSPNFSDVIALAGNSGLPAAFRTLPRHTEVAKKVSNRLLLNCRVKNRLNGVFLRNNLIKQYFFSAWTPLPVEPKTGSSDG